MRIAEDEDLPRAGCVNSGGDGVGWSVVTVAPSRSSPDESMLTVKSWRRIRDSNPLRV